MKQLKIIEGDEMKSLEKDYWGRKYKWESRARGEQDQVLRITSFGRDGVEGGGDDLFIELVISKDKMVQSRFNR